MERALATGDGCDRGAPCGMDTEMTADGLDIEGYGYTDDGASPQRLLDDLRTLSPAGIERAAWGWERHEHGDDLERFHEAERTALRVIEEHNATPAWDRFRHAVLQLTEGSESLVSWKAEHGETGHRAERAALGAALAIAGASWLSPDDYRLLARPMAEALPWLLPDTPPEPQD